MFEYEIFENRTDVKVGAVRFYFSNELTNISKHMIVDIELGSEIRFKDKSMNTIIVRPTLNKYDIYIRDLRNQESCITTDASLDAEQAIFYAISFI